MSKSIIVERFRTFLSIGATSLIRQAISDG